MAVPAIRTFGALGARVTAVEYDDVAPAAALGFHSHFAAERLRLPREEEAFCAGLRAAAARCGEKPVLIPFGRRTLGILSRHPELGEDFFMLVPTPEALETADNKHEVLRLGRTLGVPVPFTATSEEYPAPQELASAIRYPAVVKYRNGEALGLHASQRYRIATGREEFLEIYSQMELRQAAPLAQEYIAGEGLGVCMVLDRNHQLTDFICHRRIREYPASGGPSCCCETVFSRTLLALAYRLLAGLSFTGVAMVEFKGSLEKPVLMEINPRFWGSSPLIYAAGSTFYESVARTAAGTAPALDAATCEPTYRLGQKMRYVPQDLLAFPAYFKRSSAKAAFTLGYLGQALSPSVKEGLFTMGDPKPFFHYLFCSRS